MSEAEVFDQHCIVELLGHRKLAGRVREVQLAGAGFLRLDIPATKGHGEQTQYIAPGSVYAIHPTTEAIATAAAANFRPAPVSRWELEPAPVLSSPGPPPSWVADEDEDQDRADVYDQARGDQVREGDAPF
jgi:hypothetical protein